jgi:hypothetical protein
MEGIFMGETKSEMKKIKGVIEEIKTQQKTIRGTLTDQTFIKLKDVAYKFGILGPLPPEWKQGAEIEFDYEEQTIKNDDDSVIVYRNIKLNRKGFQRNNFDEIIKALTIPKIHIGFQQEILIGKVPCGNYEKTLIRTISVNLTLNPMNMDASEIEKARNLARDALDAEIVLAKTGGALPGPSNPSSTGSKGPQ